MSLYVLCVSVIFVASLLCVCVCSSIFVYVRAFSILYVVRVYVFRAVTLDLIRSLRPVLSGVRDPSFLSPLQLCASWGSDGLESIWRMMNVVCLTTSHSVVNSLEMTVQCL